MGAPFFVPVHYALHPIPYTLGGMYCVAIETISSQSSSDSIAEARELLLDYGQFVLASEGPARFCFGALEDEANGLPEFFADRGGVMLVARMDGRAAGCVTYRALPKVTGGCEMKRLWVRDEFRGLGVGEWLVEGLLQDAGDAGYEAVYCDTIPATMGAAYRMYLRMGFVACEPYHGGRMEGLAFLRRGLK